MKKFEFGTENEIINQERDKKMRNETFADANKIQSQLA